MNESNPTTPGGSRWLESSRNLIGLFAVAFAICALLPPIAQAQEALKNGEQVMVKGNSGKWLSWYKGNWVIASTVTTPGDEGIWTVTNLKKLAGGGNKFNLVNKKSGTPMDGDNDNSVVLDDTDHTWWQTDSEIVLATSSYKIFNEYWGGEYALQIKSGNPDDVVLRDDASTKWTFTKP